MSVCIICKSELHKLMSIENMPASAQNIPTKEELEGEHGLTLNLCECTHCHLVQLDCEPVDYYRDVIRAGGYSTTMEELRRTQYEEFMDRCRLRDKKILEVGCGQGEFLRILASYPVQAYGIEHRATLAKTAKQSGLNVEEDFPESENHVFLHGPFDAFTSFNFLEHQPDPLMYLRAIRHNLTKDGFGLITVPSFEYILEHSGFYEIIRDHIAYYTHESLEFLLNLAGFEVLKKDRVNRDTLAVIVQKTKEDGFPNPAFLADSDSFTDISGLQKVRNDIQKEVDDLVASSQKGNRTIAIWGASHQGFTLCSTTGLRGKVEYIIDSAPFKQGKFAPASHIPILSPQDALQRKPDRIIIVAPGYTDEIAGVIRRDFGAQTEIYSLMSDRLTVIRTGESK